MRDVAVLRRPHRVEAALLRRDRQFLRRHRIVGEEHRDAEMHGFLLPRRRLRPVFRLSRCTPICGSTFSMSCLRLGDHLLAAADRAQDELLDAARHVLADPLEDRVGVADRELLVRVAAGALGVGVHRLGHGGVRRAEIEREARAVVILVDGAAGLGQRLLDGGDDADRVLQGLAAALPAGAVLGGAPDRGVGRAADPHRQVGLHRLRARSRRPSADSVGPRSRRSPRATGGR